jgi:hypothetical protein
MNIKPYVIPRKDTSDRMCCIRIFKITHDV